MPSTDLGAFRRKVVSWFVMSAGLLLSISGTAKLLSGHNAAEMVWLGPDPVFGIPLRDLFWLAGGAEVFAALVCFGSRNLLIRTALIAFFATNFLIYRIGMVAVSYRKPCPCLGSLAGALHVSDEVVDTMMKCVVAYLLIGSYASLLYLARKRGKQLLPSLVCSRGQRA
jgi:hypothetical protein